MLIISRIILKEWFRSLIGALIILFILLTIGDIINGFMRNYEVRTIFLQYVLKLPDFMGKMLPICTLLASLFSFSKLKNHSELMGILAGGFSSFKIYSLIISSSILVALIQFINLGYIQPMANKIKREQFEKSRKNESRYLARSQAGESGFNWYKSDRYFASFSLFDEDKNEIKDISLYFYDNNNKLFRYISAKSASYLSNGLWDLNQATEFNSLEDANFPLVNYGEKIKIELTETPEDFQQFKSDITTLYFNALFQFIQRLKKSDISSTEYEILFLDKIALSLCCIIFALFPLNSIFQPNRRSQSLGKGIVFTLIFTIGFWLLQSGAQSLGNTNKISPLLATLGVPFLVLIYVVRTYFRNQKL